MQCCESFVRARACVRVCARVPLRACVVCVHTCVRTTYGSFSPTKYSLISNGKSALVRASNARGTSVAASSTRTVMGGRDFSCAMLAHRGASVSTVE